MKSLPVLRLATERIRSIKVELRAEAAEREARRTSKTLTAPSSGRNGVHNAEASLIAIVVSRLLPTVPWTYRWAQRLGGNRYVDNQR